MCGINGIFLLNSSSGNVDRDELLATRDYMYNRGPDGEGLWVSDCGRVGLGHRRLAIIELSELGAQPMHASDGQLSITFNGEIYNHNELRKQLETKGFVFRSHSDTEVLLNLYLDCGAEMVKQLRGMFAFAIWDNRNKKLIIARDPYGIKPVYYSNGSGVFRFASQVKALLASNKINSSINPAGLVSFLLWGSVSEPFTFYEHIQILPAGHILEIDASGGQKTHQYWNINNVINNACRLAEQISPDKAIELSTLAIRDSVKTHMIADVPIGTFLSAGLDSASITGIAQELLDKPLTAITLAFEEFKGDALDEVPIARDIAKILGVEHKIITASMEDAEKELSVFCEAMDQPTIDGLNTWFISKAAKSAGMKVVLSGLGGDEMLGGYATFQQIPSIVNNHNFYQSFPLLDKLHYKVHSFLASNTGYLDPNKSDYLHMSKSINTAYQLEKGLFMPWELEHVIDKEMLKEGLDRLSETISFESVDNIDSDFGKVVALESKKYMRNQLLRDTDWIGMAHSLEIRVPLVDHILLSSLVGLSATGMIGSKKDILPRTQSILFSDHIVNRPKTGFTVPIWRWLNHSKEFSIWKQNKYLCHKNINTRKRWAYCVLKQQFLL
ncbi:MAG: asparagine synthase (glutamine-hydrolyzing) [Methylococcales bacterium]|nr:asparagine synthase (glutamine-hydrolyzing) [Methylococcales bacterium]